MLENMSPQTTISGEYREALNKVLSVCKSATAEAAEVLPSLN
jgi:hypothetical protein